MDEEGTGLVFVSEPLETTNVLPSIFFNRSVSELNDPVNFLITSPSASLTKPPFSKVFFCSFSFVLIYVDLCRLSYVTYPHQ